MPVLGLGLGIQKGSPLASATQRIINAFRARVIADGGTFEAAACLAATINALKAIDIYPEGDAIIQAFQVRVAADSGTFEAYNCGIIAVQNLANIDI